MVFKDPSVDGHTQVRFRLPCGMDADRICVVGDFNSWRENATPMLRTDEGWEVTMLLPAGRSFQYRYLINGNTWINDWAADEYRPNEFGGCNSVIYT